MVGFPLTDRNSVFVENTRSSVLATLNLRCLLDVRQQMTLNIDSGKGQEIFRVSHVVTEFKTIKLLVGCDGSIYVNFGEMYPDILRI